MKRVVLAVLLGFALSANLIGPAFAKIRWSHERGYHGHRHIGHGHPDWPWWRRGHWHYGDHRGHVGWWWIVGGSWYFYPAPVYPYPPVVAVVPGPPAVTAAPPAPAPAPAPQPGAYCREFQGDAIINGTNQPYYGTACRQPDGSWRIVH
jgi:hypothetical protein